MNLYLLINILVLLVPLAFSFDRRVGFFRQWRAALPAIMLVSAFYIFEDVLAAKKGSWWFAPERVGEARLLGLPVGEWLFFLTVPYGCIFIYACMRVYVRERVFHFPRAACFAAAAAAAVSAWIFREQDYTRIVLGVFAVTAAVLGTLGYHLISSRHFWTAMGISYVMFFIVNGVLTGVPVVLYSPEAIWGVRLITIPLEDVFYNFSMLSWNFLVFRFLLDGGLRRGAGGV